MEQCLNVSKWVEILMELEENVNNKCDIVNLNNVIVNVVKRDHFGHNSILIILLT